MDRVSRDKRTNSRPAIRVLRGLLWLLPALAGFAVQRLAAGSPDTAERLLSRGLFRVAAAPVAWLTSRIPFSLTELAAVLAVPVTVWLVVRWIRSLRREERPDRLRRIGCAFRRLLLTASILYLAFMLLHGWNYARLPLSETLPLPVAERTSEDLAAAVRWLADRAAEERTQVTEDAGGAMVLAEGVGQTLRKAGTAFSPLEAEYPVLKAASAVPKGVRLSHFWSYTGITGMYFPFFVEANVNIDVPHSSLPDTMLHEIAHTRGFAREDEAGFLAYLAGSRSDSADFRYSAYLEAFISLANQLYAYDQEAWNGIWADVPDGIRRDLAVRADYWQQFEGPVREVSEQVNNAYLEANLQTDGARSYGRKADLILAYLFSVNPGDGMLAGEADG
ncbi:MAG: DUF3810 domain-containing protein [Clostridia bacterium]|nr:DUF3810 domain-containing protein [Clostridia bacterium]